MKKEKKKIGTLPIDEMKQEVNDFIEEVRENEPVLTDSFKSIENPEEYSEVSIDGEGKILSYRMKDGTKVENVGFKTPNISTKNLNAENVEIGGGNASLDNANVNSLNLTEHGMEKLQQDLKQSGFKPSGTGDWSEYISGDGERPLCIPMPRCAMLNIISDFDLTKISKEGRSGAQRGVNYDIPTQVEFWDMQGNYFKKWTLMSGQGNSTMNWLKKSLAFDFFDDSVYNSKGELGGGDAFKVKFGDWVSQDSYHLKAYYTDSFRGGNAVVYDLYDEILKTHDVFNDYPWKRALMDLESIRATANGHDEISDINLRFSTGATCFPLGFPVVVYQNGVFYGIFSWQLKKNRDNMHMEKDNSNHIHLDGVISGNTLFNANGNSANVDWRPSGDHGFEVRNPKSDYFVTKNGTEYDSESTASQELAGVSTYDETIPAYDPDTTYAKGIIVSIGKRIYLSRVADNIGNNPADANYKKPSKVWDSATDYWIEITFTNAVKKVILAASMILHKVQEAEGVYNSSEKTAEDLATFKSVIETYIDIPNQIDYLCFSNAIYNWDGFNKNWQWATWDGIKWFILPYDCDQILGYRRDGTITDAPNDSLLGDILLEHYIYTYYKDEFDARWGELRDAKVIDASHITRMYETWTKRVGIDNYALEFNKWPETPSNRSSLVNDEYWEISDVSASSDYNPNTQYEVGNRVRYTIVGTTRYFVCKKQCIGEAPAGRYENAPQGYGTFDSLWRTYKYLIARIEFMDTRFNY